jgi:hypothetical protein
MTIQVPAEELAGVASTLRRHAVPSAADAEAAARAADGETDGLLHQGASGMASAVAQKLQHALDLGGLATSGLAAGLEDVARRFGQLDSSVGTPDLGPGGDGPR